MRADARCPHGGRSQPRGSALTGACASRAGPAASAPAPAADGWGAAFLAQNSAAAGQAQAAVQAEVDKRKGAQPAAQDGSR
jgi:hypothetical protein